MTATPVEVAPEHAKALATIRKADDRLRNRFADRMAVNHDLDRTLVSFQANKTEERHRWCKYKEGFSAELVRYVLDRTGIASGPILDPFAGSGTALFTAGEAGLDAVGIELLDSSAEIIDTQGRPVPSLGSTVGPLPGEEDLRQGANSHVRRGDHGQAQRDRQ